MRQAVQAARNSLSSYQIAYDKAVLALETTKRQAAADVANCRSDGRNTGSYCERKRSGAQSVGKSAARR